MRTVMFWSAIVTIGVSWSSLTALYLFQNQAVPTAERTSDLLPFAQRISHHGELLLADLQLQQGNFPQALATLSGLEKKYPALADYVLLKRAQVLTRQGDPASAHQVWQRMLKEHPDRPAAAHALRAMGRDMELIGKFPSHPLTREVLLNLIDRNPNRWEWIAHLAFYFPDTPNIVPLLNRLTSSKYALNPDQWWAIADAYYDNFEFTRAARAYSRATANSFTAYRLGRSWHRARQLPLAVAAYETVVRDYPHSPEAPRALLRIMQIGNRQQMLSASNRILQNYPQTAPEALLLRIELSDETGDRATAAQSRQLLLENYGSSHQAGMLRWQIAQDQARRGDLRGAINTVNTIVQQHPQSPILAEACFWAGRWALRSHDRTTATRFFQTALKFQPDSYFAWRAAVMLGWQEVGDFTTLRHVNLVLQPPRVRYNLPVPAPTLNQLYLAGLDREAWEHWRTELRGKRQLTPREIFTDGVLRIGINDNLHGIRQLESLTWIDVTPAQQQEIQELLKLPHFQHNLYPFPYFSQISKWANEFSLPPALVIALIRQESRFEPAIRSRSGAIGLMQVMPDTGKWIADKRSIRRYSLTDPEDNINFGTWYLDYTHRTFNNNSLLAVASYNAGPGAIGRWVNQHGFRDPDEFIQKIPYPETRDYVPKVFGNYWNYLRLYSPVIQQRLKSLP
ncbi:MAG: transglycosylase SLT domain-containing protein [Pseudanabaenaceae cyanobacterium]